MDDSAPPPSSATPQRKAPRWPLWLARIALALLALVGAAAWFIDSAVGHRLIADRVAALRPANGLTYSIGRIEGSVWSRMELIDVRIRDPKGLVFHAPRATLRWAPLAWLANRLDIEAISARRATLHRLPETRPVPARSGPILPDFDIRLGAVTVERLTVGAAVTGVARRGTLTGRADIRDGRVLVDLAASVTGTDRLRLFVDALPDADRFDIEARLSARKDGLLSRTFGRGHALSLILTGQGGWRRWQGRAQGRIDGADALNLALDHRAGRYSLRGSAAPSPLLSGALARLTAPRMAVSADAVFARRRLEGTASLSSAAIALRLDGGVDFARGNWRALRVSADLLQPQTLIATMRGQALSARAIIDGPLANASLDYRITARRLSFGQTGFEDASAFGRGRLAGSPVMLPFTVTARRVTGVGAEAGGILANLSAIGRLHIGPRLITADDIKVRSDKLTASVNLIVDLATGSYDIGINGAIGRYVIPGLGIVDVTSKLQAIDDRRGGGIRIIGSGSARVVRLDNALFRKLAGGLPVLDTRLERTADGVLRLTGLTLRAPAIRFAGSGYRRVDGSFVITGGGTQRDYGAFTLGLDGQIARPRIALSLARPVPQLGLADVVARLDPTAAGYAVTVDGGSLLGAFDGTATLLLPKAGSAAIDVTALNVAGSTAAGRLDIGDAGLTGRLAVKGDIAGSLDLTTPGGIQRIAGDLAGQNVRFERGNRLRRGKGEFAVLLDPAGQQVEANLSGNGLRYRGMVLGRFAVSGKLVDGIGTFTGSLAGTRGRPFDISTKVDVQPDTLAVTAQGTLDRRPLRLREAARLTREREGWRLAPVRVSYAGGAGTLEGYFSANAINTRAALDRLPLGLLDIAYPGLGLGGTASGRINYIAEQGRAPLGDVSLTVRGLSRSGLVRSSTPLDIALSGQLRADDAGIRAVMASGGRTVGRAQARLSDLSGDDVVSRLTNAAIEGQVRYNGPADTLWRLGGLELFDLAGPVAIGADVTGRVNDPQITGRARARDARIESPVSGSLITNVNADGHFTNARLKIDRLEGVAGRGGRVTGSGHVNLSGAQGYGFDLTVKAVNAALINRDDIGATVTGTLHFVSDGAGGTISGEDIVLDASRYQLGRATVAAAVPRLKVREINTRRGGDEDEEEPVAAASWGLRLGVRAPGNMQVTGLGLSSEWQGSLDIGGEIAAPTISGRLLLVRGEYEFAGRDFDLSRGTITFLGGPTPNPTLDIAATATAANLNATIKVTGSAFTPQISFASVPALPEDELLSRLLFGTSITNLSAPEALQLASAVAALQDGGGGLNPINALRRAVGLDRLRIIGADVQTGQGTSVAAGKYITRRLFAEIITDGQGYSATRVEFQVTRWLSLLSSISTLGRQSVNVRVSKDY